MLNTQNPFISIVTLNWNQTDITCEFLESTRKFTYKNYEILVCDMASVVNPTEQIEKGNYPNTKVLRSEKNLGSTGGNNWGIRHAKGDFIFIVIFHKESMTMGKESAIKVYYHTRNRILHMRRNTNFFQFLVFITFFILFTVTKAIFRYLFKKQFEHLKSFVKGVLWNFTTSKYSPV